MNKMPNQGSSKGTGGSGKSNSGSCSGPRMSNDQRADTKAKPSSANPYPKGLS